MFHAYWLTSLTKLEDVLGAGFPSVDDAIFDCLGFWHEDSATPYVVIRAGENGDIVATIACNPNDRNEAIITRYHSRAGHMVDIYHVEYVFEGKTFVGTSIVKQVQ